MSTTETEPTPVKANRPVIMQTERVHCPACDSVVPGQHLRSEMRPHPTQATEQRVLHVECPHCGQTHVAMLKLENGIWQHETVELLKRSA